jgi:ribosomal protein L12E/L44/L45/RPP1/RPP2
MSINVADLRLHGPDASDSEILLFYGRKPPEYAVYRTDQRVLVHFADRAQHAAEQRKAMARLNPLRGEINGLIDGWRAAPSGSALRRRAERYDRRVGDALVVGFEGDPADAETLLKAIKQDILEERVARGRVEYLAAALATGAVALLIFALSTAWTRYSDEGLALWRASAAGAAGAFFSISLAMRGRVVLPDLERTANLMDAVLRMLIGLIAAAVLMGLMLADVVNLNFGDVDRALVTNQAGGAPGEAGLNWLTVLIVGFIAGFSERFVPDLLGKAAGSTDAPPPAPTKPAKPGEEPAPEAREGAAAPAAADDEEEDPLPEEAATDSCASDVEVPDGLVTADADLPPAAGGVEKPAP